MAAIISAGPPNENRHRDLRPCLPTALGLRLALEAIVVTNEQILAEAVRAWVDQARPGDRGVAERAALVALNCYRAGSTVSEACRQASGFVQSWIHHPAHMSPDRGVVVRLVS